MKSSTGSRAGSLDMADQDVDHGLKLREEGPCLPPGGDGLGTEGERLVPSSAAPSSAAPQRRLKKEAEVTVSVSPNGKNVYETSGPTDEVLVATANGVVSLRRSGNEWSEVRRSLEDKHVGSIVVEPNSGMVFAGAHKGGLWASEDGGAPWERADRGMELDDIYAMNSTKVGDEVRISAGPEPARLYMSKDLGNSWTDHPSLLNVP